MYGRSFVERFKSHLQGGERFALAEIHPAKIRLSSQSSAITFVFERYAKEDGDGGCIAFISRPDELSDGMHVLVLRYILGIGDAPNPEWGVAENTAELFNRHFQQILDGDFSIQEKYSRAERRNFFVMLMRVQALPDHDPIKIKAKNFDITWMDDLERRSR